jgi:hypothetical protein
LYTTPDENISILNLKWSGYLSIILLNIPKIYSELVHRLFIFPSLQIWDSESTP